MKPILFNTDMVRAILEGRKTVTRRVVKPQHLRVLDSPYHQEHPETPDKTLLEKLCQPPYYPGTLLYVRETWCRQPSEEHPFVYRANVQTPDAWRGSWCPSIHMPKETARIFLRVTGVRVERLQDITPEQIDAEGFKEYGYSVETGELMPSGPSFFMIGWDKTIKPADLAVYSWAANPWVWVIEFERCKKPEVSP